MATRARWWPLRWMGRIAWALLRIGVVGWAALAIYYSLQRTWLAIVLALAMAALGVWALWIARSARPPLIFAAAMRGRS